MKNVITLWLLALVLSCNSYKKENQSEATNQNPETNKINGSVKPEIQSPEPIIYLADNLDEKDKLGYCIDTMSKGFNDTLHVHSCKPNGEDVLFYYDEDTQQICSATYPGYCAAMLGGPKIGLTISLVKSDPESSNQKFVYTKETGEFSPKEEPSLCLAAGSESSNAGPYMSRSLTLQSRKTTDKSLKSWVIKGSK
ncbi:ricin-type beta-trefoil lectin domain protein [Formosa haliotis]|uniref:ricin-type beta-trefoil lectin domain protein n=1 Tax=Formosa haliotis TaxID=1555194 RepID=UPI0008257744|nr:ricin-type beta-trefoil lectin domain protein [Formosa haliotis]